MASFTLGTASQATGTAKSTILRAIKAGRISASRDELNQWQIEPAELFRVFPALAIPGLQRPTEQGATQIERDAAAGVLVVELRATLSDMRRDRDRWHEAFEKEQAAHARTQDALAMTQRLLPPPSATPTEHGATAVEQDATPPNAQIERDATPIKKGEVPDQAVPFGRSGITEPDLPPLGIQCTQKNRARYPGCPGGAQPNHLYGESPMPLAIGFAFFIGIVMLVLLGSNLLGPDSWPIQSDREAARRAQANADRLRQRLRAAVPRTG